ncbi:PepSY-associated TM helix domain-containing protein [Arcicella sp. LKC2W]|uniref:PepSY-associated TM helix domain-containing protein n=1 Tax=Arcicella sp. LKC2W TaxID=2984198 RepID=UPI002B205612|nr:PepSY-associated TM helix domain-containing protein [Arcicella sp. LKC2W]MEA5460457.1 PepSY-associated TM helix domain-containing protein [Arcicella sp. LKC2W]
MTFKKITHQLHLWLGLSSGLVVFIVSITGCLYAFKTEIEALTEPYLFAETQAKTILPPSVFEKGAKKIFPKKHLHAINYAGKGQSVEAIFYGIEPEYYDIIYFNPYSAEVLKVKDMDTDFFRIILMGHYYLWLPANIGQPIVASATLIFVILLISGIILWWPKNKAAAKQRFQFKWKTNTQWKRKNYDLHNVLGFYASWVVLIIALTGLVWGFEWFANSVYWRLGGEKSTVFAEALSDTTFKKSESRNTPNIDILWKKISLEQPNINAIEVHIPDSDSSSIAINTNTEVGTTWKIDYRYFDQYSLKELSVNHLYGRLKDAKFADKAIRMNYDVHIGAIFGFAGKLLAFFVSLISASLPITGVYIWWGRRNKQKIG